MKVRYFSVLVFLIACLATAQTPALSSPLGFSSSIPWLTQSFIWAKGQALAYTHTESRTMGPWYEAALPGRNAFCMRDVSHQTKGAAALGLYAANRNMLGLFAQSAEASRDWTAYWEIDGEGKPSAADYVSDNDFWFNLPANFDVLDASIRMWLWTGDNSYRNDPVFQHFFHVTMTDYLSTWQLDPDIILKRPRIANQRLAEGHFVHARGIPSYFEGSKDFIFGTDLLAAEYRAMRSFSEAAGNQVLSQATQHKADAIQSLLERIGWSEQGQHYFGTIRKDLSGYGSGDTFVLYFGAPKDPMHIRGALNYVSSPKYWKQINIEEESYVPLTLFRYGRNEIAYQVLADISGPQKSRREYPEVSYSVIEAIVSGVMGLSPGHANDEFDISTLSRLPADTDHATLTSVAMKGNMIDVSHAGHSMTRLLNRSGKTLHWRAEFLGTLVNLRVDGKNVAAKHLLNDQGIAISWVQVNVVPGATVVVSK